MEFAVKWSIDFANVQEAFKYLSYVMYPLLVGYAIYSVVYEEHKSWYSYIVGTLVGFVYAFGESAWRPVVCIWNLGPAE